MDPGPNCPHYKRSEAVAAVVVLARHPGTTINQRQAAPDRVAVKTEVHGAVGMVSSGVIGLPAGGSVY